MSSPDEIAAAAQLACLLEASAPKPGNVSPGLHFRDTRYEDFLASAVAIGPPMARAGTEPLGVTILSSVTATARWTQANTNLGIVLLLAPLARAALSRGRRPLRDRLAEVLRETTVEDAVLTYRAIRLARPGGLGTAPDEDVREAPHVTLAEAMGLAADRDDVAREYVTRFSTTFEIAVPALRSARRDGLDWTLATLDTYLTVLSVRSDSLIARKLGSGPAAEVSVRAAEVQRLGGARTTRGLEAVAAFDAELRDVRNEFNPGTTADMTAAALFAVLVEGGWSI